MYIRETSNVPMYTLTNPNDCKLAGLYTRPGWNKYLSLLLTNLCGGVEFWSHIDQFGIRTGLVWLPGPAQIRSWLARIRFSTKIDPPTFHFSFCPYSPSKATSYSLRTVIEGFGSKFPIQWCAIYLCTTSVSDSMINSVPNFCVSSSSAKQAWNL